MNKVKVLLLFLVSVLIVSGIAASAGAMTIGYFDTSREQWGFDGNNYLSNAKQWLLDEGHTLVTTDFADADFLNGVDAFYTGLIGGINGAEVSAMQNFVDVNGGFLFIQQDHDSGAWFSANNTILGNWGIAAEGTYNNDSGHYTVGSSDWVTDPNTVTGFSGAAHSVVVTQTEGFEVLAYDDLQRPILGVYDAGAGRSSDVLIATDINFWDDSTGWLDARNRDLWENIWKSVEAQTGDDDDDDDDDDSQGIPEPATMLLFGSGLFGLAIIRKRKQHK